MKKPTVLNYAEEKDVLRSFLVNYTGSDKVPKYADQLAALAHREQVALYIELDDLDRHDSKICQKVVQNCKRYVSLLNEIVQDLLPQYKRTDVEPKDSLDIFIEHRLLMQERLRNHDLGTHLPQNMYPPELMRRFEIYFKRMILSQTLAIRHIKAKHVGQLITVRGLVTRCTEVKPMISVATYSCDSCGAETYQPDMNSHIVYNVTIVGNQMKPCPLCGLIGGLTFMPLTMCPSDDCRVNKSGGRLHLQSRGSKFVKFQELTIQEPSEVVPVGHIPRAIGVFCRGENTRKVLPGDHVLVTGVFLPMLRSGYSQMSRGLISEHFLDVHSIKVMSKSSDDGKQDHLEDFTESDLREIQAGNLYNRLAASLAPEIYGHEDVKKALLLMLVGGADRKHGEMKIRGNIHMCLMGDPGVAKSQLLSYIDRVAPRSQYTTGRGSTGVGLTAAVVKDPLTGELALEGGALILADEGICCIDEFDKMSEYDRTAIHEVMEQQTVSIAKAGIVTSLNARVSVLAAANPAYGRYNPKRSVEQNVQLPAALLSRFDLLWLIRDVPDRVNDLRLAQHIAHVHRFKKQPESECTGVDLKFFRKYVAKCRTLNPSVPKDLSEYIVQNYVEMRKRARNEKDVTFTSPRNLLAVLRLATALARLRISDKVVRGDIQEAIRLIEMSKQSIVAQEGAPERPANPIDHIYETIRDFRTEEVSTIKMSDIVSRCIVKGFQLDQINRCIEEYEELNIWAVNQARTTLTFL